MSNTSQTTKYGRKEKITKRELRPFFSLSFSLGYYYCSPSSSSSLVRPPSLNLDRSKKSEYLIGNGGKYNRQAT